MHRQPPAATPFSGKSSVSDQTPLSEEFPQPRRHNHGNLFRAKIVPFTGATFYGEWFESEAALRAAMQNGGRVLGNRYYCETKRISCPECETGEAARVIATL